MLFTSSVHSVGELLPLLGIPSLDPYRTILESLTMCYARSYQSAISEIIKIISSLIVKAEKIRQAGNKVSPNLPQISDQHQKNV